MALSAKAHGLKKVTFLVENVPAAIQGAQVFGAMVYKAAGVGFAVVPVNEGNRRHQPPDAVGQCSVAADVAVGMVGDVTLCTSISRRAYNTLGLKIPKYVLSTCQDSSILNSPTLDKALTGSYITTATASSKADLAQYAFMMKKFAPKVSPNPNVSSNQADGVTPVLALGSIMKGSTQPVTAAGVKAATAAATNVTIPLSGGLTFTCNGTAIPLLKSGVLGERRHRGGPERQGRQGRLDQGLQPDAAVLTDEDQWAGPPALRPTLRGRCLSPGGPPGGASGVPPTGA